jgi:hydroxymethylbilane synthase
MSTKKRIKIATRSSQLALLQTRAVIKELKQLDDSLECEIIEITTSGDKLKSSLRGLNGKAMFVSELQAALLSSKADIAVHSLKDMSITTQNNLAIIACLKRQDASDAFVSNQYIALDIMPKGSIIGTASVRRSAFIRQYYPDLRIKEIRGNIDTRISKMKDGYDAILLATNGLERMSYNHLITERLPKNKFIPAIGQAVVAIESVIDSPFLNIVQKINHPITFLAVQIERHIGALLGSDCGLPVAVYVDINEDCIIDIYAMSALKKFIVVHQQTTLEDINYAVQLIVNKLTVN